MPRPPNSNGKLLLIPQWWNGDQDQMMALLKLLADIGPGPADFLLFPRVDTRTRDWRAVEALEKHFTVYRGRSTRPMVGWPQGPNAVAMDVFRQLHLGYQRGEFPYSGAMLIEADCVPLRKTWLTELLDEWDGQDKLALGHWDGSSGDERGTHMNGNLIFHPCLVDHVPEMAYGPVPSWGWDMKFWPFIRPYATASKLIYSDYRLNTPRNPLHTCEQLWDPRMHTHQNNPLANLIIQPAWLHGVKGLKAIECVRNKIF